jgi:hypothetical protein
VCDDLPDEAKQIGRLYFARSPESDIWVSFDDLPEATVRELWENWQVECSLAEKQRGLIGANKPPQNKHERRIV